MLVYTVGHKGEDFYTIGEAISAVPYNEEARIIISEGLYEEKVFSDKKHLEILGKGDVTIRWHDGAAEILPDGLKRGTFRTYTAFFSGQYLHIENITIENTAGKGRVAGQAIALYLDVDNARLDNVNLYGYQDTLFLSPLPDTEREKRGFYGPRCYTERKKNRVRINAGTISGSVDFIFGGADALFTSTRIISREEGYVTAPSGKKEDIGFIFKDCSFINNGSPKDSVYLMRPWRKEGKARFLSCSYEEHINRDGLSPWPGKDDEKDNATFRTDNPEFPSEYRYTCKEYEEILSLIDAWDIC